MIFLGVGSSIGNAKEVFSMAEAFLERNNIHVLKKSNIMKNPPLGGVAQNEFSNMVWEISFPETPWEKVNWRLLPPSRRLRLKAKKLLKICKQCEGFCGRKNTVRWGDRTLDLDILMFHQLEVDKKLLHIPHKEIPFRDFVLLPWSEIVDQNFEIPTFGLLKELVKHVPKR